MQYTSQLVMVGYGVFSPIKVYHGLQASLLCHLFSCVSLSRTIFVDNRMYGTHLY